jgi:hypothetical protein
VGENRNKEKCEGANKKTTKRGWRRTKSSLGAVHKKTSEKAREKE